MGPILGRQDPGGPHVGPMNFAIWDGLLPDGTNVNQDPWRDMVLLCHGETEA